MIAERMAGGAIEALRYPRNPLDVLAQHVVAMVALDPWTVDELAALVRRAAPFAGCRFGAARRPGHAGRALPIGGVRRAAPADHLGPGQRRAARAAGRAAASGHLRRHHPGPGDVHRDDPGGADGAGSRVGELDEEMVYESRVGDTFLLGSTSGRSWTSPMTG